MYFPNVHKMLMSPYQYVLHCTIVGSRKCAGGCCVELFVQFHLSPLNYKFVSNKAFLYIFTSFN